MRISDWSSDVCPSDLRRAAAAARRRGGRRDAPAVGSDHHRRSAAEPDPDPLHHAGGLSVPRPPASSFQQLARCSHRCRPGKPAMNPSSLNPSSLKHALRPLAAAVLALSLGACTLGPDYQRPELPVATDFNQAEGWKAAAPADVLERGEWWRLRSDE